MSLTFSLQVGRRSLWMTFMQIITYVSLILACRRVNLAILFLMKSLSFLLMKKKDN